MGGNPETTPDIATPSKRGTIHSKDSSLAPRRTAGGVVCAVRVCGDSPYRICALEREKCLRDVGFDERYTTCFSDERDELEDRETDDLLLLRQHDAS